MDRPLEKLVLRSAAKFKLSSEAKALLIVQAAKDALKGLFPTVCNLESDISLSFRKETVFIRTHKSALSSEIHMRRLDVLRAVQKKLPHIPCKYVVVLGAKK